MVKTCTASENGHGGDAGMENNRFEKIDVTQEKALVIILTSRVGFRFTTSAACRAASIFLCYPAVIGLEE
jgi:hypothetical protein